MAISGTLELYPISLTNGLLSILEKKVCFLFIKATISLPLLSTKQLIAVGISIALSA